MQASYTVTGDNGQHAIAQLESRIKHDAQEAGPAAAKLLGGVVDYVRGGIENTADPVVVEIDLVVRARTTTGGIAQHLAPPVTDDQADDRAIDELQPAVSEGNPEPVSGAEGEESDSGGAS